ARKPRPRRDYHARKPELSGRGVASRDIELAEVLYQATTACGYGSPPSRGRREGKIIMPQSASRIVLASRPVGEPKASDFRIEQADVPVPGAGEVLLRTIWLSLDPYMRGRMSDGPSYAQPVPIG